MPKRSRSRRRTSASICVVQASRRSHSLQRRVVAAAGARLVAELVGFAQDGVRGVVLFMRASDAERPVGLLERRQARALRRQRPLALEVALELRLGRRGTASATATSR